MTGEASLLTGYSNPVLRLRSSVGCEAAIPSTGLAARFLNKFTDFFAHSKNEFFKVRLIVRQTLFLFSSLLMVDL